MLFGLALLDELVSGIASAAAPDIEVSLGLTHALTALVLFVIPGVAGFVVEPLIFLAADRARSRAGFVRAGVAAMAATCACAALVPGAPALAIALAGMYVAIGTASGVGQAMLVSGSPENRGRVMARWTLLSLAGDLAAPALLFACAWRQAYLVLAALLAAWTIALCLARVPEPPRELPEATSRLRDALRDRALLRWLLAMALCDLLDEILVVFASIHVREDLGGGALASSATIAAFVAGGALGLVALDRLLRHRDEQALLLRIALACAVAYAVWLLAPTAWSCAILALPVGATAAPLWPLASARAYATRPDAPGLVQAGGHLFTPLSLALPFLVGAVADHLGTWTAPVMLLAQPLGLVVITLRSPPVGTGSRAGHSSSL